MAGANGAHEPSRPAKVVGRRKGFGLSSSNEQSAASLKAVDNAMEAATAAGGAADAQTQAEIRRLKAANQDQAAEISRLKAALTTYESADKRRSRHQGQQDRAEGEAERAEGAVGRAGLHHPVLRAESPPETSGWRGRPPTSWKRCAGWVGTVPRTGAGASVRCAGGAGEASARRSHQRSARTRLVRAGAPEEEAQTGKGIPRRVSGFLKALDGDSAETRRRIAPPSPLGRRRRARRSRRRTPLRAPRRKSAAPRAHHRPRQDVGLNPALRIDRRRQPIRAAVSAATSNMGSISLGSLPTRTRPSNFAPSAMTRFFWMMSPSMLAVECSVDGSPRSAP